MSCALCIFGEVLFDEFPDGRRVLGGAPFNVAWHLAAFGEGPLLISRVGADADGDRIRQAMRDWGMDVSALQVDSAQATGRVRVQFNQGEPEYDIVFPSAWDVIEAPQPVPNCDLLYHGSLACRDARSRETLDVLMTGRREQRFVDVNMRKPWWNREAMLAGLHGAAWVKLNADELLEMTPEGQIGQRARSLMDRCHIAHLLVTQGKDGARLFSSEGEDIVARPSAKVDVIDTVGAGDALASVMMLGIARGWPLEQSLHRAQAFASAVVGLRGATSMERSFYERFLELWA